MVMVGDAQVGKTSLVLALYSDSYEDKKVRAPTDRTHQTNTSIRIPTNRVHISPATLRFLQLVPVMPKVTIPPHVTPENVATIIIDTSCERARRERRLGKFNG